MKIDFEWKPITEIPTEHWYEFVALEEDVSMLDTTPYKFYAYDDGIALEGFEWLDIILKID